MRMKDFIAGPVRVALRCGCRWSPLTAGHSWVVRSPLVRRCFEGMDRAVPVRLRNGIEIRVNARDYNGRMLYLFGTPDPKVVAIARALLTPGSVMLDIGANYGAVGLLCQDVVGPQGEVHLVEPQPELCERIRECVAREKLGHVTVHEMGLMDRDDVLVLNQPVGHSGRASFGREFRHGEARRVPVRHAGAFVTPLVGSRAVGVKLDVEGVEEAIVPHLLTLPGLRFVVMESNADAMKRSLWGTFGAARFALFGIEKKMFVTRLRRLRTVSEADGFDDVVAVPASPALEATSRLTPSDLASCLGEAGKAASRIALADDGLPAALGEV
jgi:FkbM family methyltransferase